MTVSAVLLLVIVWVLAALIPLRAAPARRVWVVVVLCVSVLVVAGAAVYGMQHAHEWAAPDVSYDGVVTQSSMEDHVSSGSFLSRQWEPAFFAAVAMGPGALVALLRLALSEPE
ncbi:hypothetical protein [Streptomyces sp. NBC_00083]|uniref:hypothetical protein n=1 Tax=Streptomyces sp. NBC_00083 TaxID=2975647 RepID=UPI00224CEAEF|nr:hypothetical protein [Streptomyces sp. NBC_00083]MCX5384195.1 hypothetical protein [Streptomyces sp. NBC_00083]